MKNIDNKQKKKEVDSAEVLIYTDQKIQNKYLFHKKVKIGLLIFAILLFSVVVLWMFTDIARYNNSNNNVLTDISKKEELSDNVLSKTISGQPEEAIKLIEADKKVANTSYGQDQIALVYINSNQPDKAIEVLQKTEKKYGLSKNTSKLFAITYESTKDYKNAIFYYQKYIDLIKSGKDYPLKEADIKETQVKIQQISERKK